MKSNERKRIWDRLGDGQVAQWRRPGCRWDKHGALVRGVALAKVDELALISAEFGGEPAVFDRRLRITTEGAETIRSVALFLPSYASSGSTPTAAVRRATWEREKDRSSFEMATSKRQYLESVQSIDSQIGFVVAEPLIMDIWAATEDACRAGVPLVKTKLNVGQELERVAIEISFDTFCLQLGFSPRVVAAPALEPLVGRWRAEIDTLMATSGVIPDEGTCHVSYDASVWERIARFAE